MTQPAENDVACRYCGVRDRVCIEHNESGRGIKCCPDCDHRPAAEKDAAATSTEENQMDVTIVMSEAAARAVLQAVEDDPDRSKWGHHQWVRSEAIHALSASLTRGTDE